MKRLNYKVILVFLSLAMLFAACTDENYKVYDTTQKDAVFFDYVDNKGVSTDSVNYAFNYDIATVHTINIPVRLMGMPSAHERKLSISPVDSLTTMVEGTHYTIDNAVLPADSVQTTIKVNLIRNKDSQLREKTFVLYLRLGENDDLRAVGKKDFKISYSDIRPAERPDWWVTYAPFPTYSFESAQLFFQYFYANAPKANPDVFDEMITAYGDYFTKATSMQGPYAMYTNFLVKYVLIPMYKDHKDDIEWQSVPSL